MTFFPYTTFWLLFGYMPVSFQHCCKPKAKEPISRCSGVSRRATHLSRTISLFLLLWVEHKNPTFLVPGSHCETRTPTSRITAFLNQRNRAKIHHQLNWKGRELGLSLTIKWLIPVYMPLTPQGWPMGSGLNGGLKHSDNKGKEIINHGKFLSQRMCRSYMGIPSL